MVQRQITYSEAGRLVRNRPGFYDAMLANNYHPPSKHSNICTLKFMRAVRKGQVYCPRKTELNVAKQCYNPPPKSQLLNKLLPALQAHITGPNAPSTERIVAIRGLIGALKKRDSDRQWLIDLLAIFKPDDEVFAKSYKYVRPREDVELLLDNEDGFFDDLPLLNDKQIRKTNRLQMPKKVRQAIRLKKVKEHQLKLLELEADLERELNQTDSEDEFAQQPDEEEKEDQQINDYATEGSAHDSDEVEYNNALGQVQIPQTAPMLGQSGVKTRQQAAQESKFFDNSANNFFGGKKTQYPALSTFRFGQGGVTQKMTPSNKIQQSFSYVDQRMKTGSVRKVDMVKDESQSPIKK